MKRYRVWQANREIFLWPENWLYPELRDDQSPFFEQMMSDLLQGDITDDAAQVAYLNYLTSLEAVAKLEPCGIYYVPGDSEASNEISYVVGRTAGAHGTVLFPAVVERKLVAVDRNEDRCRGPTRHAHRVEQPALGFLVENPQAVGAGAARAATAAASLWPESSSTGVDDGPRPARRRRREPDSADVRDRLRGAVL